MAELTVMQRALRPVVNFLVERFFSNGCFYGDSDPMRIFERHGGGTVGRAAAMVLIRRVHEADADQMSVKVSGVTSNGIPKGDWRIIVKRTDRDIEPGQKGWSETTEYADGWPPQADPEGDT